MKTALGLSGETPPAILNTLFQYMDPRGQPMTAHQIAATNCAKRAFQEAYLAYWNSTASLTGTGRPVDGFFSSASPYPAAQRLHCDYMLPTIAVNVIDHSSIIIPVTRCNKQLDPADQTNAPLTPIDKGVQDLCQFHAPLPEPLILTLLR